MKSCCDYLQLYQFSPVESENRMAFFRIIAKPFQYSTARVSKLPTDESAAPPLARGTVPIVVFHTGAGETNREKITRLKAVQRSQVCEAIVCNLENQVYARWD